MARSAQRLRDTASLELRKSLGRAGRALAAAAALAEKFEPLRGREEHEVTPTRGGLAPFSVHRKPH
jgi:hypothetical protein